MTGGSAQAAPLYRAAKWMRDNLFSSVWNGALTIACLAVLYAVVPGLLDWLWLDAVVDASHRTECRDAGSGACWAVVINDGGSTSLSSSCSPPSPP